MNIDTENQEQPHGNWMAVIPATILFDNKLNDRDKIIYAIVSNLTHERGYCWATNKYLAEKLDCTIITVQRALKKLSDRNYLDIEVLRNDNGTSRIIRLENYQNIISEKGISKKKQGGTSKMIGGYIKKDIHNSIIEYNSNSINKNINTSGVDEKSTSKLLKFLNERYHRNFRKIDSKKLKSRLKIYSLDEMLLAIENAHSDKFHIDSKFKYLTPEYFTRNDDIIDKWLNTKPQKTNEKTGKTNFSDWAKSISSELGWNNND
jgi:DNA-binding MarR family transcriptional regulator